MGGFATFPLPIAKFCYLDATILQVVEKYDYGIVDWVYLTATSARGPETKRLGVVVVRRFARHRRRANW
jgi:hypothetical protein